MSDRARLEKWVVEVVPVLDEDGAPVLNADGTPQEEVYRGWRRLTGYLAPPQMVQAMTGRPAGSYRLVDEDSPYGIETVQEFFLDGQGSVIMINQPGIDQMLADIDRLMRRR